MIAPRLTLALAVAATLLPPAPPWPCAWRGSQTLYLGHLVEDSRDRRYVTIDLRPVERVSTYRGRCGTADRGALEWDPSQEAAFRCTGGGWHLEWGANTLLRVEGMTLTPLP